MVEEEAPPIRQRSVGTAVRLAMLIQVAGVALGYWLQFFLARRLGSSEYGVFASAVAWSTALAVVAAAGLPMSALRFIPEYVARSDWPSVKGFLRFGYGLSLAFSAAMSLGCVAILAAAHGHLNDASTFTLIACSYLIPLLTISSVQSQLCRGFKWIVTAFAFPMLAQPVLTVAIALLVAFRAPLTSGGACVALGLAVALSTAVQGLIFAVRRPADLRNPGVAFDIRKWIDVSVPLWIICGFFIVLDQLDILMVTVRLGARDAGLYNAAMVSSRFVALALAAVNSIAAPTYASLYAQGKRDEMQALASKVAHWITWPAVGVLAVLCLFGKPILHMFGADFVIAYPSLVILATGQFVNAACGSVGYLLGLTGHQRESMRVLGWAAAINVALNLIGMGLLGLTGAAIGTAVSMAIWNLWLYRLVVRHLNVRPSIFN